MFYLDYTQQTYTIVDTGSNPDAVFTTAYKCMIVCELGGPTTQSGTQEFYGTLFWVQTGTNTSSGHIWSYLMTAENPTLDQTRASFNAQIVPANKTIYSSTQETGDSRTVTFHIFRLPESL